MADFKLPTEQVDLPSQGLLYPEDHPLAAGKVEMKYMTAREEDILTNQAYIEKGVVIDKLLQSMIVTEFDYDDLLVGDKNALLVAARILGYGKSYKFKYEGKDYDVDLSLMQPKPLPSESIVDRKNEFKFTLPASQNEVTFKLLTQGDEKKIEQELKGLRRLQKDNVPELSTRLKHIITSINGNYEKPSIREFVTDYLLAQDSAALRSYVRKVQPDIDLSFFPDDSDDKQSIPIGIDFLYPEL